MVGRDDVQIGNNSASEPIAVEEAFWRVKKLEDMSREEWESLCDGCGRCCMLKLEDEDTNEIYLTRLACRLLDIGKCRCRDYENRHRRVPDCLSLDAAMVRELTWLPETCAYRLLSEGRDLPDWHPLVTGDPDSTRAAGMCVTDYAVAEEDAGPLEEHVL